MKKNFFSLQSTLVVACFTMLSMNSCMKLTKGIQYDLNMQTASMDLVIPPYTDTNISVTGSQTNYYNIDSFIKARTGGMMGLANITRAKLESCVLVLNNSTQAENFANFRSCIGTFYTNSNTTPYVVNIASNPDVFADTLTLPVDTSADLTTYVNNGTQFTYSLGGRLRRATHDTLHCTATFKFNLHVQGL